MAENPNATRQHFAHALLSPLTVVLGSVEMLLNQAEEWPEYARELLQLALAQGHRLQGTLTDLISASQVNGSTVSLSWVDPAASQPAQPPNAGDES